MEKGKRVIGICIWCRKPIYENQPWEEMYPGQRVMKQYLITQGPIHKKCSTPYLKIIVMDLINDINGLEWLLQSYIKKKNNNKKGQNKPTIYKNKDRNTPFGKVRQEISANLIQGNNITQSRLIKHFVGGGFNKEEINGYIDKLKMIGDIFEPVPGQWKGVRKFVFEG